MRAIAVALAALLLAGCAAPAPADCGTGTEYRDLDRAFRLCIPTGWLGQEHVFGRELFLFAPLEGEQDAFQENVNIGRERVPANLTLRQYADTTVAGLAGVDNFTLEERRQGTLGTMPAEILLYRATLNGVEVRTAQAIAFKGTMAHVVTAISQVGHEAVFAPGFDLVQASYMAT